MNDAPMTYVFVHGAWHDGWCWHLVARELETAGHPVVAIDLPLAGSDGDVEAVETAIASAASPVILVGHSYGGTVIGEAASERSDVEHLVYVCAMATPIDQDANQAMAEGPATHIGDSMRVENDHVIFDAENAIETFYTDCPGDLAREALRHLRPMGLHGLSRRRRPAFETIPSTYVVCTRDRALHPEVQEKMATHCSQTLRLETDHSPFLSTPIPLARILLDLAR